MDVLIAALERARRSRRFAIAAGIVAGLVVVAAVAALTQQRASGTGNGALAHKAQVDNEIHAVLSQMDAETDAARLAVLERRLGQLIADAQRALDELRKRGGSALALASAGDQLDVDIRRLLQKFGAETYAVPPIFKERVRYHIARLFERPDLLATYQRKKKYWPLISKGLASVGLPEEMGYVVWAESLFDPTARSETGSFGIWQFQAPAARIYGLRIDEQVDERADVAKSTHAAARYLADMLSEFGSDSFMLALASYNSGQGKIRRALHELAQEPGGYGKDKRDFWHLYRRKMLSEETREYVPTVLAAALIGSNPERYGLE
jgi:soluble lytic murein transglycosylase-like protein